MTTELNPADAVREAPTELERIIAEMRYECTPETNDWADRLAALAGAAPVACDTTERLVSLLRSRDALGRKKYGTSLDRADLTAAEWLQHLTEELLDAAGYAQSLIRANAPAKAREDWQQVPNEAAEIIKSGDLEPLLFRLGSEGEPFRLALYRARQDIAGVTNG